VIFSDHDAKSVTIWVEILVDEIRGVEASKGDLARVDTVNLNEKKVLHRELQITNDRTLGFDLKLVLKPRLKTNQAGSKNTLLICFRERISR